MNGFRHTHAVKKLRPNSFTRLTDAGSLTTLIFIKSLQMSINISILRIEFMKMRNDCKQHLSLTRHLKLNLMKGATR